MKYQQFLKQKDLLKKLLIKMNIIEQFETIIKINNFPDTDVIPTDWREDDNNYFKNSWQFGSYFKNVMDFNFLEERIYHFEHIKEAEEELDMRLNSDDIENSLNLIDVVDSSFFQNNGYDTDLNETFKFHKVRLVSIDNVKRTIWYDGSFFGNHETYDNQEWGTFSKVQLTGIPSILTYFYQDLLGESYLLYHTGNYKMAYFIAYAAMENYVNSNLDSEETKEKFKDKLKQWLKTKVTNLDRHEVYCAIIKEYDDFCQKRNIIAHGKENIEIEKMHAESALLFVAILICSFENSQETFDGLFAEID
jgi:hypothetical protein